MAARPGQVRENLARRTARRQGMELRRVSHTGPGRSTTERWRVLDLDNGLLYGGRDGLTLNEAEAIVYRNQQEQAS